MNLECAKNERSSRLESKSKRAKIAKGKGKENEVSINVGFMKLDKAGNFKKCRGKTLPIKVLPSADKESILVKSVRKHSNHDKTIHEGLEYVLLFPDGNEVVKLPGTDKDFSLKEYREDVGRTYNRVALFIATRSDFLFSECPTLMMIQTLTKIKGYLTAILTTAFMKLVVQIPGVGGKWEPVHHLRQR